MPAKVEADEPVKVAVRFKNITPIVLTGAVMSLEGIGKKPKDQQIQ